MLRDLPGVRIYRPFGACSDQLIAPGLTGLLPNARIAAPLLSRGGESRRGSGGWGGAGQENHYPDQHHY